MPEREQNPSQRTAGNLVDRAGQKLRSQVERPVVLRNTELGYDSIAGTYGYTLRELPSGTVIFDPRGIRNKVDRAGDRVIRRFDEHVLKNPLKMYRRHPGMVWDRITSGPKRSRGSVEAVVKNAQRLGLADYYGLHAQGIEVRKPEIFTQGINLLDIYRVDNPVLKQIDRNQALRVAGAYLRQIHKNYGAIGEVLINDIIYQRRDGVLVKDPVLNLPDIPYNPAKYDEGQLRNWAEPRGVDMLDFLMSVGAEEYAQTQDWGMTQKAIDAVVTGYGQSDTIQTTGSLAKRGRLTISGDEVVLNLPDTLTTKLRPFFSMHNMVRLDAEKDMAAHLREVVIDRCRAYK